MSRILKRQIWQSRRKTQGSKVADKGMKSRRYWSAICVRGPRGSGVPEPERSWWVREPTWSSVLTWLSTSLNKYWRIPKHYKYNVHLTTTVLKCLQMCSLSEICSSISGRSGSWQILSNTRPPRLLTPNLRGYESTGLPHLPNASAPIKGPVPGHLGSVSMSAALSEKIWEQSQQKGQKFVPLGEESPWTAKLQQKYLNTLITTKFSRHGPSWSKDI